MRLLGVVAGVVLAGLVSGACTSTGNQPAAMSTTAAPAVTTTTAKTQETVILDAYRHYWDIYIAVGVEQRLPDPRLSEVTTGDELRQLNGAFLADRAAGHALSGTIDLAPRVIEVGDGRAVVRDCQASHLLVIDRVTGRPLGPAPTERTLLTVTMLNEGGAWKVAAIRHEGDGCTPEP